MGTELPQAGLIAAAVTPLSTVLFMLGAIGCLAAAIIAYAYVAGRLGRELDRSAAARLLWGLACTLLISALLLFWAWQGLWRIGRDARDLALALSAALAIAPAVFAAGAGAMAGALWPMRGDATRAVQAGQLLAELFVWWMPRGKPGRANGGNGKEEPEFEITMASGEEVEAEEREYIENILELGETTAREVMVPRTDVVGLDSEWEPQRIVDVVAGSRFSRFPVYDGSLDNVVGVLHLRELLEYLARGEGVAGLRLPEMLMEPYYVPGSKKIDDVLRELQLQKGHMAIVLDEYGGTAGILTIEDLLEEIVGEIQDEFDEESKPVHQREDGSWVVAAHLPLDDFNELLDASLETEDVDTLGGFIANRLGHIPHVREAVDAGGFRFTVLSVERNRIRRVQVERLAQSS